VEEMKILALFTIAGTMIVAHMASEAGDILIVLANALIGMSLATVLTWPYIRAALRD
jgi:uncharacterized protein HemY